jgi:hypothetical protein
MRRWRCSSGGKGIPLPGQIAVVRGGVLGWVVLQGIAVERGVDGVVRLVNMHGMTGADRIDAAARRTMAAVTWARSLLGGPMAFSWA